MKPAPFEYLRPTTIRQTIEAIAVRCRGEAAILAGGQALIGELKLRTRQPSVVVDISRVAELHHVQSRNGDLQIGSMLSLRQLENENIVDRVPALAVASRLCGPDIRRRNRATVGGALVMVRGAEVLIAAAACEDASLTLASVGGSRVVSWQDCLCAPGGFLTSSDLVISLSVKEGSLAAAGWVIEVRHSASLAGMLTVRENPDRKRVFRLSLAASSGVIRLSRAEAWLQNESTPASDDFEAVITDAVLACLPASEILYRTGNSRIASLFIESYYRAISNQTVAVRHVFGTRTAAYASKRAA